MHTRIRAVAGVTAGALALGVLALSPAAPSSANHASGVLTNYPLVSATGTADAGTYPYLTGSVAIFSLDAGALAELPNANDAIDVRNAPTYAARVTSTASVGVFGRLFLPNPDLLPSPPPIGLYDCDTDWSDVAVSGSETSDTEVFGFGPDVRKTLLQGAQPAATSTTTTVAAPTTTVATPTNLCGFNVSGVQVANHDVNWIAIHGPQAADVTVQVWLDDNGNGKIDTAETVVDTRTVKFVAPSAVTVDVLTETVDLGAASTQVYSNLGFTAIPMVGTDELRQSDLLPFEAIGTVSGRARWTSGSFASLNGRPAIAAQDFEGNDPWDNPYEPTPFGVIYAANTGSISLTGWFDPTGKVPPVDGWDPWNGVGGGDWITNSDLLGTADAPVEAPLTPPTGFVANPVTVTVGSTQLSRSSSMTASGTGVVPDGDDEYSVPLSTTAVTFELTAKKVNVLKPNQAAALPYPAGTPVEVLLQGDYRAASNTGPETFSANGVAINKTNLFADGVVVKGVTDANGKFNVLLTVTSTGLQSRVTDLMAINASLVKVNGQPAPMWQYTDGFCDDDLGFSVGLSTLNPLLAFLDYEYLAAFLCDSGNTANNAADLIADFNTYVDSLPTMIVSAPNKVLLKYAWANLVVPNLPGFRYIGPAGVETTAVWNKVGRVSNNNTTGTLDGLPFVGDGQFYSSVVSNSTSSMTVTLKDTFGSIIPGRTVELESNPVFARTVGGTSGANGSVTFGIPGIASGYRLLSLFDTDEDTFVAAGAILYQPVAQMTAGAIAAPPRQQSMVTEADEVPIWQSVKFRVINSVGDPMAGVIGIVTTSNGVVARTPGSDLDDELAVSGNIVAADGSLTVWVASRTAGMANVTLSIGGKSATAKVDFLNRDYRAKTLSVGLRNGKPTPSSVDAGSVTKMRVLATDANGNPIEKGYIRIKVKGDARLISGGRQQVLFTNKNGVANFRVRAAASGSFRVIAVADQFKAMLIYDDNGWWSYGEDLQPERQVKARTPEIQIKK